MLKMETQAACSPSSCYSLYLCGSGTLLSFPVPHSPHQELRMAPDMHQLTIVALANPSLPGLLPYWHFSLPLTCHAALYVTVYKLSICE